MGMQIKLDKADIVFSQYIRLRDRKCVRCGSLVAVNSKGFPVSHQASHYFGRGCENTRYDDRNVDCLCAACHVIWGGNDREDYRDFKMRQIGEDGLQDLRLRSQLYCKKDRAMALIYSKQLLASVL